MTTTMASRMSDQNDNPTPAQSRRGRRTALVLFAIGFGPIILATAMFYTGWLNPTGHTNNGTLIQPVVAVSTLNLETLSGDPLEARFGIDQADPQWLMIVAAEECGQECEHMLYLARQVNIALGKNASHVARAAVLGSVSEDLSARWEQEYRSMERLVPVLGTMPSWPAGMDISAEPRLLLVDPFGNVMMHYGPHNTGKEMLKDLNHLLRISQAG
ncbi:MAG TPA: hypothetical protein VL091_03055 [Marinobacter sp.]|nr:hypothetical protein [Marinobacter sp.]